MALFEGTAYLYFHSSKEVVYFVHLWVNISNENEYRWCLPS